MGKVVQNMQKVCMDNARVNVIMVGNTCKRLQREKNKKKWCS